MSQSLFVGTSTLDNYTLEKEPMINKPWQNPYNKATDRACRIHHVGYADVSRSQFMDGYQDAIQELLGMSPTERLVYWTLLGLSPNLTA